MHQGGRQLSGLIAEWDHEQAFVQCDLELGRDALTDSDPGDDSCALQVTVLILDDETERLGVVGFENLDEPARDR
jgi:hypothetical protein